MDPDGRIPLRYVFKDKVISANAASSFGIKRNFYQKGVRVDDFHNGIDIKQEKGTTIRTLGSGVVSEAGYDRWNGNHVKVDHGNGIKLIYDHMSEKPIVNKGDELKDGQDIGKVGSTGLSTGDHLHISLKIDGMYADVSDIKDLQKFLQGEETATISVLIDKKTGEMEDRTYRIDTESGKLIRLQDPHKNLENKK